jgi:hypothetical protein
MYQTEISPDIEKLTKSMSSSNLKEVPSPSNKSVTQSVDNNTGTQSGDTGHVIGTLLPVNHDETLKHPSEVLIEFKVSRHFMYMFIQYFTLQHICTVFFVSMTCT